METAISTNDRKARIAYGMRILLSVLFLFSVFAKLYPSPYGAIATFEAKQLNAIGFAPEVSVYFSRFLIGAELALGLLLLQRHYFKRLILPVSFLMLLGFCIHLAIQIAIVGDKGNCGCMGDLLPMKPSGAIIKNVIAMILMAIVYRMTDKNYDKMNILVPVSTTLASMLLIFMVPMSFPDSTSAMTNTPVVVVEDDEPQPAQGTTAPVTDPEKTTADPKAPVKDSVPAKVEEPKKKKSGYASLFADIDNDKKILCFFAPGCDHCQQTAKELTQLKKQIADFPDIRIVFMDEEAERIPEFFEFAGAKYTHMVMDVGQFWTTFKGDTPGVFYLWNGNLIKSYDGIEANAFKVADFKKIVQKPWSELK
jgi:thiol-disulfide isomerase/thioredoxin